MDWYSPPLFISQDSVSFQRRADTDWRLQGLAWFSCCLPLVLSQCWFSGVGTCSIDFGRTSVFVTDLEPWPPRAYRGHLSDWRQEPPACGHSHAPRAEWKSECSCTPLQDAPWHRSNLHTHSWGPCPSHGPSLFRSFCTSKSSVVDLLSPHRPLSSLEGQVVLLDPFHIRGHGESVSWSSVLGSSIQVAVS